MASDTIRIAPRFCGPPTSGNGGYVAGLFAQQLPPGAAAVRLAQPPPLDTDLAVRELDVGLELVAGEQRIATARSIDDVGDPLAAVSFDEASVAAREFVGFEQHYYPGCFVCGTERESGDGLRVFPGPLPDDDRVACPWTPDASLAGDGTRVAPEFVWAALDCPGGFAFPAPEGASVLLGELRARLFGEVTVGERCVLVSRQLAHEGRKHTTATTLYGEDGGCRGLSVGIWIEVATA